MIQTDRFRLLWMPFLRKIKGRTYQAVGLVFPPVLGSGGELELTVGKRKYRARTMDLLRYPIPVPTQNDQHVYLWLIPRPAKPTRCRVVWKTPLGRTLTDSLQVRPAEPGHIHVIFKTHLDLGYTHRLDEVIRLFQTTYMESLLDNLDRTASYRDGERFVWTLSTWLMEQCLDPEHVDPEHLKRLEAYVRKGQVVWGLMPFTTHTEFFGLEELCRSIYAARRLAERYGVPVPRAAKMTDVPGHTASLAMAFAAAGGTFFQIGTNPDCRPPRVPPLFWWELPDGRPLLCHYHTTYGTPLLPPPEWPYRDWLAIQITNDNVGPQNLDVIHLMQWIRQHFDYPVCRAGRLEDFADSVIRHHGRDLPTFDKEPTDWWIHGIGSQAEPTALAREDKHRLPRAEALGTVLGWAGGASPADAARTQIRDAYEQLTLYTEHTWGDHAADARQALPKGNRYTSSVFATPDPKPPVDRWVGSWEDKARFARRARALVDGLEQRAIRSFAAHVGDGDGAPGIALFNMLSWARGGPVSMPDDGLPKGDFELIDPTTGGTVYHERRGGRVAFIAPPVPACGYLVLDVRPVSSRLRPGIGADWLENKLTLHSDGYTLQFHRAGGMARWHDRDRSCQWCSTEADFPMGTYLYEMPGEKRMLRFVREVHTNCNPGTAGYFNRHDYEEMTDFGPVGGDTAKITPEVTPLFSRVVIEAACPARKVPNRRSGDARRYRTTFTHYRGQRDLHVRLELFGKRATYGAEAGYAFFPFSGENPYLLVDRIAHAVHPDEDVAAGANTAHMAVHRGIRVELQHSGINFYPIHTPLIGFNQPGAWAYEEGGKYDSGILYANLFNNCWGTNFAQWQSGDFSYEFVIRPTGNDDWDGGLARGGAEVHHPLVATVVHGRRGEPARSLLHIRPDAVQLVALKPAEFTSGTVMRLWNADVEPVRATLVLPAIGRGNGLYRCDLLERPEKARIKVNTDGEAVVRLEPNEIATLLLTH